MNNELSTNTKEAAKKSILDSIPPPHSPAFVIGVTGNMDPLPGADPENPFAHIKEAVKVVFRRLRSLEKENSASFKKRKGEFGNLLAHEDFGRGLERWAGIPRKTPIVVLSSLAPGADSIVAEVALDKEFRELNFHVQAPLPFPPEQCVKASTFNPEGADAEHIASLKSNYVSLIAKIKNANPDAAYAVLMESDLKLSGAERKEQFVHDLNSGDRQRLRFQAAGEHIAIRCDLLLAIWDDDFEDTSPAGTGSIVEAKYAGPASGILPGSTPLAWSDSGTIFHIHARRKKVALKGIAPNPERQGKIRIIHPRLPDPSGAPLRTKLAGLWNPLAFSKDDGLLDRWMEAGNRHLARIADLLGEFNRSPTPTVKKMVQEAHGRIGCEKPRKLPSDLLGDRLLPFLRLCGNHRRAGDAANKLAKTKLKTILAVFVLTLSAALLIHLYAHWHPQEGVAHAHGFGIRAMFLAGALVSAVLATLCFWNHHGRRCETKAHDYRAFAEALRVQIAWCLSGLARSVTSNYMQRQRGELEWIRSAISSVAAPLAPWCDWFDKLSNESKIDALRRVNKSWIAEQADYFKRSSQRRRDDLHFFHKFGGILALAGLWHLIVLLAAEIMGMMGWLRSCHVHTRLVGLTFLASVGLWWACLWIRASCELRNNKKPPGYLQALRTSLLPSFKQMVRIAVPGSNVEDELEHGVRRAKLGGNFIRQLAVGLVVFIPVMCLNTWIAYSWTCCPSVEDLTVISMGILLAFGAMSAAWAERNQLSEEAYQYGAMAQLFEGGRMKIERLLRELEEAKNDKPRFDAKVREVQDLIYALGREALAENAEWLILHRARPMEPVMAG